MLTLQEPKDSVDTPTVDVTIVMKDGFSRIIDPSTVDYVIVEKIKYEFK